MLTVCIWSNTFILEIFIIFSMYAKPRTKDPWSSCSFGTLYLICDSRLAEMEWHARHSYFVWRLAKMLPPLPDKKKKKKNRRNRASDQGPASRKRLPLEPHALFARRSEGACLEIGYRIVRSGQSNSAAEFSNPLSSRNRWRISCLYSLPLRSVNGDEVPTRATRVPCPVSYGHWPMVKIGHWPSH